MVINVSAEDCTGSLVGLICDDTFAYHLFLNSPGVTPSIFLNSREK